MKDGTSAGGFIKKENATTVFLVDATGKEHRLSKRQISETNTTSISLMPPNFGEAIPKKDFRDLLGWLLNK